MSKFDSLFPTETKSNIFGEAANKGLKKDIEAWIRDKNVTIKAPRIEFILGPEVTKKINRLTSGDISDIGTTVIDESGLMNAKVDELVQDLIKINKHRESVVNLIRSASAMIEQDFIQSKSWIDRILFSNKTVDESATVEAINNSTQIAIKSMSGGERELLIPFIQDLALNKNHFKSISSDLNETIFALDFIHDKVNSDDVKDMILKRKMMFSKAIILMDINLKQLDDMSKICEDVRHLKDELEMNIVPAINNVLRSIVISKSGVGKSMVDIAKMMKALV